MMSVAVTVAELIAQLQALPPHDRILVDGHEAGYDDPKLVRPVRVTAHESTYCGTYRDALPEDDGDADFAPTGEALTGWVITRYGTPSA